MRLFNFLANQPWAITEAYAHRMLEIYNIALERKAKGEELDKKALEKELGRPLDNARTVTTRQGVATIPVEGPLFRRADMFTDISGATTIDTLAKDFHAALDDPAIKAIILYVDSPGGEVNGTNEFADMVYAARDKKPIVAYIAHSGASAAYWIASAADEVVIDGTAALGSIGVVAAVRDPNKENKRDIEFVSSQSPNKRPDPTTESGKAQIQAIVDDLGQVFVEAVARNRNVKAETVVKDFGAGGLLIGQKAVDAGLADRVGSYESVLSELSGETSGARTPKPRMSASVSDNGEKIMADKAANPDAQSRWDRFTAWMDGESSASAKAAQPAEESAEVKALRLKAAQADKYKEQISAAREAEAKAFVGSLVTTTKQLLPAGMDKAVAAYIQASEDDELYPLASGSRVEKFKASFTDLPKHNLTTEMMPADLPAGAVALNPDPGTQEEGLKAAEENSRAWAARQQKNNKSQLQGVN